MSEQEAVAVRGDALALPAISGEQMVVALTAYRALQKALDVAMPDQIMDLDGKKFRKKGYWRAISLAFKLSVEPIEEKREVSGRFLDSRENFGWTVTYRASHPSGRGAVGDGSCFAVEKARRFKCPHPESEGSRRTLHFPHNTCPNFDPDFQWRALPGDATEHNVRSHAHTRAFNRAVSNLVGFGEVSAEEVEREEPHHVDASQGSSGSAPSNQGKGAPPPASATGNTTVKEVTKAKAEGKPSYVIFADGRKGSTFSEAIIKHAEHAKAAGALVNPTFEVKGKYTNLTGFDPIAKDVKDEPVDQAAHPDEAVTGPEHILTVRKVDTESGPRWVIQTDKRQLVTDQQAFAEAATKARADKVGLIPAFEVVPRVQGGTVNKLTEWKPAEAPRDREPGEEG
jgi:hypothetical protein